MTDMDIREEKTDSPHEQLIPKVVNVAQKSTDNEGINIFIAKSIDTMKLSDNDFPLDMLNGISLSCFRFS